MDGGFRGLDWIALVVHRRRRTGEVVDLVDLDVKRKCHVVSYQLETRVLEQMLNVGPRGGIEVIYAQHLVPSLQQSVAEVRSNEARSSRDEHPLTVKHPRPRSEFLVKNLPEGGGRRLEPCSLTSRPHRRMVTGSATVPCWWPRSQRGCTWPPTTKNPRGLSTWREVDHAVVVASIDSSHRANGEVTAMQPVIDNAVDVVVAWVDGGIQSTAPSASGISPIRAGMLSPSGWPTMSGAFRTMTRSASACARSTTTRHGSARSGW